VKHKKIITKKTILNAFELFDTNKDGFIDIEEFKTALPTRGVRSDGLGKKNGRIGVDNEQ